MYISKSKKDAIRRRYIAGQLDVQSLAESLKLQAATIRFYLNEFRVLEQQQPDKLQDYSYFIGKDYVVNDTAWYVRFAEVIKDLVLSEPGPHLVAERLYQKYVAICPNQFSKPRFYHHFKGWFDKNEAIVCSEKLKQKFTSIELAQLTKWRRGNDRRLWQVSVALMTVYTYHSIGKLARRIEISHKTLLEWISIYNKQGLAGLSRPGNKKPVTPAKQAQMDRIADELVHMVRQQPKSYGIDKVSWTLTDLAFAYSESFGWPISFSTVNLYLKKRGVRFKRSREVLVSSDPQFREKYDHLQYILGNLGAKERFFSIDEYGPKSVRPKGGRQFVLRGQLPVYHKVDKSKGWFICTCALELSTNQLTWFYSRKKDTNEMIKLIDVLTLEYQEMDKLFLSWDAASWHDSQQLKDYLMEINDLEYRMKLRTPEIIVVPLPAKAPHLNVVESVFSGMAKSVIHNSDYTSVEECTSAIDRYFNQRNQHYLKNPKRAGDKIWGKEKVKPVFNKANICRHIG